MKREQLIKNISDTSKVWDMVVVGGGSTGLGVAVDAAARGFSVALFEWEDFAKATSSRSTKLVHGGRSLSCSGRCHPWFWRLFMRGGLLKKKCSASCKKSIVSDTELQLLG